MKQLSILKTDYDDQYERTTRIQSTIVGYYRIDNRVHGVTTSVTLTDDDFIDLLIESVIDFSKRHPEEYKEALERWAKKLKTNNTPTWEERPHEEIKPGDFVKCINGNGFCFDEILQIGNIYKVVDLLPNDKVSLIGMEFTYFQYRFIKVIPVIKSGAK